MKATFNFFRYLQEKQTTRQIVTKKIKINYIISMIKINSLVLYKSNPATVTGTENGKFAIRYSGGTQNVRENDMILLHEGPVTFETAMNFSEADLAELQEEIKDCWELLRSDDETKDAPAGFADLSSLSGRISGDDSWKLYSALKSSLFFQQDMKAFGKGQLVFIPRTEEEIEKIKNKNAEKEQEALLRDAFIQRLKNRKLLPEDSRFMLDVEALALGKSDRSRTMQDAHLRQSPENAHRVLLETGIWNISKNPYPMRWGMSMRSASASLDSPADEERISVDGVAWAIDNEHSTDPDDAVCFDGKYLWVHIADPASTVQPDSEVDRSARSRGATLYIPEGAVRMLCEKCPEDYALGLTAPSRALSFRLLLDDEGNIAECQVMKTLVNVRRLTYAQAQEMKDSSELKPLFDIAARNLERRRRSGAVSISIPEVNVWVDRSGGDDRVCVEQAVRYDSSEMIREMMLLAGEGAAKFAFRNSIPFPYISQEAPELPGSVPDGLAGEFARRKCMKRRMVGLIPSMHCSLGLSMYSQVTSPLRRYGDLLAHMQLRAFIDGRNMLDRDTMLQMLMEGENAAQAASRASRKSEMQWKLVYLLQNPEWTGEAICVDLKQKLPLWFIPSLGMETSFVVSGDIPLNGTVMVRAGRIDIPELLVDFMPV